MTLASINADLALAQAEFTRLNSGRWDTAIYAIFEPARERQIVDLAMRIERLNKFRSFVFIRGLTSGGDGAISAAEIQ